MCRRLVVLTVLMSWSVIGLQKPGGPGQQVSGKGLTLEGVMSMVEAGLSDDVIITRLRKEDKPFDLSPEEMISLKKAKASDAVLKAMLDPAANTRTSAAISVTRPGAGSASGATPNPGSTASGDPNDPMTPHDSGIYLYTKDRDGKTQMIVLERASYQGSKTGGMWQSAVTYGIAKAKVKAVIPGPHASISVTEQAPVFYFYFDEKQTGLGKTYFGSSNVSNPNQFALLRLEVNKQNRETTVGEFSALGGSSGTDSKSMIPFKSDRVRPGLYRVAVTDLKTGEYCFVASSGMVSTGMAGVYGRGATGAADLFDFAAVVE